MKPIMPHSQDVYLYFGGWYPEDDKLLLEFMIEQKAKAQAIGKREDFSATFIKLAHNKLKMKFTRWQDEEDIEVRIELFKKRYHAFKFVVNYEGAVWEVEDEYVRATDKIWKAMLKENYFVVVYYLRDEPKYANLTWLSGPDPDNNDDGGDDIGTSNRRG